MATRRKSLRHKGLRRICGRVRVVSPYISKVYNRGVFLFLFCNRWIGRKRPGGTKKISTSHYNWPFL